jgi:SAM-dependent methyltransferase
MPTIDENRREWNERYGWDLGGAPWSKPWGSAEAQWNRCIHPRIAPFLPAPFVLEIAPGYGRWTEFLLGHCDQLVGVDVAANCTEACRQRFAHDPRVRFETNDGRSLPMVADGSVDFAFSFDSLVHVEADAIEGYLTELARVLKPDGVAFIHHSNFGTYQRSTRALAPLQPTLDRLPTVARAGLLRGGVYKGAHWRATSMTAARFAEMSVGAGLHCVGQEQVNWEGGILLLDTFSVVTRPGSPWDGDNRIVKNWLFRAEARSVRRTHAIYDTPPPGPDRSRPG